MSKELYIGDENGKARLVTGMYIGVGGVARKVRGAYVGDENGKARLFYGMAWNPGIITPDNMSGDNLPIPYRAAERNRWDQNCIAGCAFNNQDRYASAGAGGSVLDDFYAKDGEWWIEIDLGEPRFANRGRVKAASTYAAANSPRVWPTDFNILATNDGSAWADTLSSDKWVVVGSVTGYARPANFTWGADFVLSDPGFYRYYRFSLLRALPEASSAGNKTFTIGQIELRAV